MFILLILSDFIPILCKFVNVLDNTGYAYTPSICD